MSTLPRSLFLPDGTPVPRIYGAEGGYHTAGDLVRETIDGRDVNVIWDEFQTTLQIVNEQRTAMTNLLCFTTDRSADIVAQATEDSGFEVSSEFGVARGMRPEPLRVKLGYAFEDFDLATRYTWKFLRDASAEQVELTHRSALAADNRLTTHTILQRVLDPTPRANEDLVPVHGLWNGDDMVPPRSGFNFHEANHTHYLTTQSAAPTGVDLDDMANHIRHHGYGTTPGSRLILFVHTSELSQLTTFRSGEEGAHDFIPAANAPAFLSSEEIVGDRPPGDYNGLKIAGSYGDVWISPSEFMPPGYLLMVATEGPNSPLNPVGYREHPSLAFKGLRLVAGVQQGYPLQDAYYARGFGVGVRHRGAAVAMQITESPTYAAPTELTGAQL